MKILTHVNSKGQANMVDVSDKKIQHRSAKAEGYIRLQSETIALIKENKTLVFFYKCHCATLPQNCPH